jgi:DNA-binding CsgD family transcriptional regulator
VSAIATAPASITSRAHTLLEVLHQVVAFDAAHITLLDPERRIQPSLARFGYPDRMHRYLNSPNLVDDLELLGLHRDRPPMRFKDSPVPLPELPVWMEWIRPSGFNEGVGVTLRTPDGRYLGVLGMHTYTSKAVDDVTVALLGWLAPVIAHAVDPLRAITGLASLIGDATAGLILTRAGNAMPLPGLPPHPLLAPGSRLLRAAAAAHAAGGMCSSFLAPDPRRDGPECFQRITTLACSAQPPHYLNAVVLVSPPGDLHGLTRRELTVLGMLIEDWDRRRIAAALRIPAHVVFTVADCARAKLGAPNRAAAVVRASGFGLYLPPALALGRR